MFEIIRGVIKKKNQDKNSVQVLTSEGEEPYDAKLLQLWGMSYLPKITKTLQCIVLKIKGSRANSVCLPFDNTSTEKIQAREEGELVFGNPHTGSKITFKANGDVAVELSGETKSLTINGKTISITGDNIKIGGGNALALNMNAQMQVTVGGPGVYTVQIVDSGQTKVKI